MDDPYSCSTDRQVKIIFRSEGDDDDDDDDDE